MIATSMSGQTARIGDPERPIASQRLTVKSSELPARRIARLAVAQQIRRSGIITRETIVFDRDGPLIRRAVS